MPSSLKRRKIAKNPYPLLPWIGSPESWISKFSIPSIPYLIRKLLPMFTPTPSPFHSSVIIPSYLKGDADRSWAGGHQALTPVDANVFSANLHALEKIEVGAHGRL